MKLPGFKILDRYILGKFLSTYLFTNAMIIVIVVVFDYAEKVDDFTASNAPMSAIIFDYYVNFIPSFINQFSGLLAFISVIFFTSKMAYQTEIVAMLSGGMSFRRFMWPYFIGAAIIASISMTLSLWIIPVSQRTYVAFDAEYIDQVKSGDYDRHIYRQVEPGIFVYLRNYQHEGRTSFFTLDSYREGKLVASLEASAAYIDSVTGRWRADRYITREFREGGDGLGEVFTQHRNLDTLINLERTELARIEDYLKTMKIGEIYDFLDQQRAKASDSIILIEVAKHTRFAYPIGTFILTLIGVSLSSRKVRGGTGLHIGIGTALCFSYILFNRFAEEFAKGGALPPNLAVWSPNLIFLAIGLYLYYKAPK